MLPKPAASEAPALARLFSGNPIAWLAVFGPGAVMASLTIGVGELIFSSRGGALFGYRLLWFFLLVLALKWVLVFSSARHMVLTGAHPFQRWMALPGPRGWFPLVLFLLAAVCFPIWICFHAGTLGTLASWMAGTEQGMRGGAYLVWGMGILAMTLVLSALGGYRALEKIQTVIILLMLLSVVVSLFFLKPDWFEFCKGLLLPQPLRYPDWLNPEAHGAILARPVWVETTTYVGVIGGSSYDYLAYVSYLRDKHWGQAGSRLVTRAELQAMAVTPHHPNRRWLRAPMIDCTLSFLIVLVFTAVFVVCGTVVLGPQHKVPSGSNLLLLQAEFVTSIYPWLRYVYFSGAILAILGTLYGTIEVAPAIVREMALAFAPERAAVLDRPLRLWSVLWAGLGGLTVLVWSLANHLAHGAKETPSLIAILTPANLFTGVLGCGLICLLNIWMDRVFLPRQLRMPGWLMFSNAAAGLAFLLVGIKAYWDHSRWQALGMLAATVALGWGAAWLRQRLSSRTAQNPPLSKSDS